MDFSATPAEADLAAKTTYNWGENDSITVTLLSEMSDVTGEPIEELPPLAHTIDIDCLEGLFRPLPSGDVAGIGEVRFCYHDFQVCVHSTGEIRLYRLEQ